MMITKTNKAEKKKINWLFPDKDQTVTPDDFREMVKEAEKEKGMTLSEYKAKMSLWWESHL